MTRRKFLGTTLAGGATLIAGGSNMIFAANSPAVTEVGTNSIFRLGGDLPVNRLGFGAMRINGIASIRKCQWKNRSGHSRRCRRLERFGTSDYPKFRPKKSIGRARSCR